MARSLVKSVALAAALTGPVLAVAAENPSALVAARRLLDQNDPTPAIALLESAIPAAAREQRAELIAELKRAYEIGIRRAESEGRTREAGSLREDLAVLSRLPAPKSEPEKSKSAPAPAIEPPAPPKALTTQDSLPSRLIETETAPILLEPADPATPEALPEPAPKPTPRATAPAQPAPDLDAADAAFRAKRYAQAGEIYAALERERKLPAVRRDAWAYCRMESVVRKLNTATRTPTDWKVLQAEIDQIRRLSPNNWYAEYLRNLVAELSGKTRPVDPERTVLRGGTPEEPPPRSRRRQFVQAAADANANTTTQKLAAPPAPVPPASPPPTAAKEWQTLETANFRILHADAELARKIGDVAEATRAEQTRRWGSPATATNWTPKCDIYVYPNAAIFHARTGQPEGSPGFSTMGLDQGRVIARRVNLRADHPNILAAILPHEITHVVLADLFPDLQIPRWADEGIAVLSEPLSEQDLRAADLSGPLAENRLFRLADLMTMDYPDGRYWSLYYAQSVALTRYLVSQGTPRQFVEFVRGSQRNGVEPELKRVYRISGYEDLQRRWLDHVRATPALAAKVAAGPNAGSAATR